MKATIYPMPIKWNGVYETLQSFYQKHIGISKPPIPLILGRYTLIILRKVSDGMKQLARLTIIIQIIQ